MTPNPTFADFTWATTGRQPFPWQIRLANQVRDHSWPSEIGVPTGLGKTACIDIAIWVLSAEADQPPAERRHPSRIWYVVNRRLLVDEGWDRAERLAELLREPRGDALKTLALSQGWDESSRQQASSTLSAVAKRLATRSALSQETGPLHIARLRGGVDLGQLPTNPAQPAVLLATAPMFGSRLLFRGYGSSRYTRSLDAAYAGTDSVVLLDEAHLSQQLATTARQLGEADAMKGAVLPGSRDEPTLVALTATGERGGDRFDLDEKDFENATVSKRIHARKPTRLVATRKASRANALAKSALEELQKQKQPTAAVVFSNTASLVPAIHKALLKSAKGLVEPDDIVVLTGRLRGDDAAAVRRSLLDGPVSMRSGRNRQDLSSHRVVIATQTLEVGADLDFDILVTESAGVRALTQRLGRLNRLGEAPAETPCVIVHAEDQKDDPVYGTEPAEVWGRLKPLAELDLGPLNTSVLGRPADHGARSPELLPNHLDEYVKTTDPPLGEAPVDLFINGIEEQPSARVTVAWRSYNPPDRDELDPSHETDNELAATRRLIPALRSEETVEVPIWEFRELLKQRDLDKVSRLSADGLSIEQVEAGDTRPGDQLFLGTADGGYREGIGWDATSTQSVVDLSAKLDDYGIADGLLLEPTTFGQTLKRLKVDPIPAAALLQATTMLHTSATKPADEWWVSIPGNPMPPETDQDDADLRVLDQWQDLLEAFGAKIEELELRPDLAESGQVVPNESLASELVQWIDEAELFGPALQKGHRLVELSDERAWSVRRKPTRRERWASPAADAFDELSLADRSMELARHLASTGAVAEHFARTLGLSEQMVLAVGNAGRLHDLGKAEPRFQAWLGADTATPIAKSGSNAASWQAMQQLAGWPSGGRHELLSVRVALAGGQNSEIQALLKPDPDLVLHLVASHHGRGRPGLFGVPDAGGAEFEVDLAGLLSPADGRPPSGQNIAVSGDLATHDLAQPVRFHEVNERYGRRGVALLECIVRQADWAASAATESGKAEEWT